VALRFCARAGARGWRALAAAAAVYLAATVAADSGAEAVAAPTIAAVTGPRSAVPRFGLAEFVIDLTTSATRVYYPHGTDDGYTHPDGITVEAVVTEPDGTPRVVPAFYFTPYALEPVDDGREALGVTGASDWRIRFTPRITGRHRLVARVIDAGGRTESPPLAFDVEASSARGFVRVSTDDPRFLRYDNGDDYVPVAEGRQWAPQERRRALSYAEAFARDAAAGVNLTRLWDQNDSYNLSIEGADAVWAPTWSQFSQALGIDLAVHRSGARAARFRATGGLATEGYAQWVAVRPSTRYELRGWVRTDALDGDGAVLAAGGSSTQDPGPMRTAPVTGTVPWREVR
jgi:hypothetical protein